MTMMSIARNAARCAAIACCLAAAPVASAQSGPHRLDDSGSPRGRVHAPVVMSDEGRPLAESLNARTAFVRIGRVQYRLAAAPYLGRQARIYFVVPTPMAWLRSPSGLQARWRGGAWIASDMARAGERRLVWTGVVTQPWLSDAIDLEFEVDLQQVDFPGGERCSLEPYFEIEVMR